MWYLGRAVGGVDLVLKNSMDFFYSNYITKCIFQRNVNMFKNGGRLAL